MEITNPYKLTIIEDVNIPIYPIQMDNSIKTHIKNNTIEKYEGYNYKNYGNIIKIYSIEKQNKNPSFKKEDVSGCAVYKIKIKCKLCIPIRDTYSTFKVDAITLKHIKLKNGSIICHIRPDYSSMNKEKIKIETEQTVIKGLNNNNKWEEIIKDSYVCIKIEGVRIEDKQKEILVKGYIERLSLPQEIELYEKNLTDESFTYKINKKKHE